MYGREIGGQEFTFGVSGKLIMNALVMYDHQTETLWSQFLRKAVKGPLLGTELDVVPVTQTTWSSWVQLHPDTLVLDKRGSYRRDNYEGYYSGRSAGVIGETNSDDRLNRKELVLGVDAMGETKAYPLRRLEAVGVLNDTFAGNELLVFFDPATGTALAYDRVVDGTPLTFRLEEGTAGVHTLLVDEETNTIWLAYTGRAVEGKLEGQTLDRALSHLSFWFSWTDWNPDTELYTG